MNEPQSTLNHHSSTILSKKRKSFESTAEELPRSAQSRPFSNTICKTECVSPSVRSFTSLPASLASRSSLRYRRSAKGRTTPSSSGCAAGHAIGHTPDSTLRRPLLLLTGRSFISPPDKHLKQQVFPGQKSAKRARLNGSSPLLLTTKIAESVEKAVTPRDSTPLTTQLHLPALPSYEAVSTSSSSQRYSRSLRSVQSPVSVSITQGEILCMPVKRRRAASLQIQDEMRIFRRHRRHEGTGSVAAAASTRHSRGHVLYRSRRNGVSVPEANKRPDTRHRSSFSLTDQPRKLVGIDKLASRPRPGKETSRIDVHDSRAAKSIMNSCLEDVARNDMPLSHSQLLALHQLRLPRSTAKSATLGLSFKHPDPVFASRLAALHLPAAISLSDKPGIGRSASHSGVSSAGTTIEFPSDLSPSIPSLTPPVTRKTLRELDLPEILQCRQLRHDVVFDANLMFRPNFDGDRCGVVNFDK